MEAKTDRVDKSSKTEVEVETMTDNCLGESEAEAKTEESYTESILKVIDAKCW